MRALRRRGAVAACVAMVCAGFVPASAQGQRPFSSLQTRANAWGQIQPLLRDRAQPKPSGFDFEPTYELKTAAGYKVRVTALGSTVAIIAGRDKPDLSAYLARGVATSRRLQASFGPFGKLDMRFHPSAAVPRHPRARDCHGVFRHLKRAGTWTGTLRFKSEGRYVVVDIHRARGSIRRRASACFSPHRHRTATASSDPFSSFSTLNAVAAGWHQGLEFAQVVGLELGPGTIYGALSQHTSGSVAVLRMALVAEQAGTLTVNSALTHAEISPPAPFHGTGTYTATPDGTTTWTGDLTVNFPDAPAFPLTGEQFKAEAKRAL